MRVRSLWLFALLTAVFVTDASATLINVAEGKPVTLTGEFGVMTCCWAPGPLADGSTLVDGLSLPESSVWQTDTVWWDERNSGSVGNSILIDLLGTYTLVGFAVQADNNDTYLIEYQDALNNWLPAWAIPSVAGFGMTTRSITLGSPIVTDTLRFTATGGDQFYSVSEIQASAVPEPGTLLLLGGGLAGLALRRRRKA